MSNKIRYLIKYVEDEDEDNVKTYGVHATSQRKAHDIVDDYIEEHNHHPSINYGYTLSGKPSAAKADYEIE